MWSMGVFRRLMEDHGGLFRRRIRRHAGNSGLRGPPRCTASRQGRTPTPPTHLFGLRKTRSSSPSLFLRNPWRSQGMRSVSGGPGRVSFSIPDALAGSTAASLDQIQETNSPGRGSGVSFVDYPFHGCIHVYLESSLDTHEMVLVRVSMTIRTWLKDFFYLQAAKKKNMSDPDPLSSPLRSRVHWVPRPHHRGEGERLGELAWHRGFRRR